MEFEKFIFSLPDTPSFIHLKNFYESYYNNSSDKTIVVPVLDHNLIDIDNCIAGYLWEEEVDGNGLVFVPFKSFELVKNYIPSFIEKGEQPLNVIAFDFLLCAISENKNIPAMQPYLKAMLHMNDIEEDYYYDSGVSIVIYFLDAIKVWRSKNIKPLRDELKMKLKRYERGMQKWNETQNEK